MKRFILGLLIAVAFLSVSNVLFAGAKILLKPGALFYQDGIGYNAGLEMRLDGNSVIQVLPSGLFMGLDLNFSRAEFALSNFSIWDFSGVVEAGYTFPLWNNFIQVSPIVKAGGAYASFANSVSNLGQWGFLIIPAVSLEFPLNKYFSVGLETEYSFFINGYYNLSAMKALLLISYNISFNSINESKMDSGVFEKDLQEVINEQKIKATVKKENENEIKLSISDVLFDIDSDKVSKSYMNAIKSIVRVARNYSQITVSIEGHSDDRGDEDYNALLSAKRAKNVAEFFIAYGMASSQISYKGWGMEKPLVSNTTEENRAVNRRVEIRFIWK